MTQTLTTQAERDERIHEMTSWEPGDYARFAAGTVESQLAIIAANEASIAREAAFAARPIAPRKPVEMYRCSCGHTVPRSQVMSASLGSSCPDCYDRLSD